MKEVLRKVLVLVVNGKRYELTVGDGLHDMPESELLADTLRNRLELTGLKIGCGQGACGCCTVIMNGEPVTSCMTLTMDCDGAEITTIEGLAAAASGELSGLQKAFIENSGYQCGFCTPGIIVTAKALLDKVENPTEEEIREALAGNYCRCGTHYSAVESIMNYVAQRRAEK